MNMMIFILYSLFFILYSLFFILYSLFYEIDPKIHQSIVIVVIILV
jgi:hypothetical protein